MGYLVSCPCGHAVDRHDHAGCHAQCACRRTPRESLDAVISDVNVRVRAARYFGSSANSVACTAQGRIT